MKRAATWTLVALLALPAVACKDEQPSAELEDKIERRLAEAATNLANDKVDEAEQAYRWVLEQKQDHAPALTGLAKVALARDDFAAAIEPATQAVAKAGDDAEAQATLGRAYAGSEQWAKAAEHLGAAWKADGEQEQLALEYGVALRESGDLEAAKQVLAEAAELNPKLRYVYRELARVHLAAEELDAALTTFMKAQSAWAGDQDAFAGAAMVYEAKGDIPKAIDQWSAYIQQDCCSTYSKEVAQPKLAELKAAENAAAAEPG